MSDGRTWGTIIGGVVGYFTGGIGFAAGAAIGGAVGSLLEPKKHTETNRIDDIKVSLSKYGDGIPEVWGNNIPSATCIWSTYIIEIGETQSQGKGGGVENTNYRQFIQSMWCLGRTPPPGTTVTVRKVWIDGKLNFDGSTGQSVGQALATEENPWASIAVLPGFDGQLPVALIETYEGVGNVPAFTGRVCIFIFGLECPGGRVPQLQFELCFGAETVIEKVLFDIEIDTEFSDTGVGRPVFYPADVEEGATSNMLRIGAFTANSDTPIESAWEYGLDGQFYRKNNRRVGEDWPVDFGGPFAAGIFQDLFIRTYREVQFSTGIAIPYYVDAVSPDPEGVLDGFLPSSEYLYGLMISVSGDRLYAFTSEDDPQGPGARLVTKWYEFDSLTTISRQGTVSPGVGRDILGFGSSKINSEYCGIFSDDFTTAWTAKGAEAQKWEISGSVFAAVGSPVPFTQQDVYAQAITIVGESVYIVGGDRMACLLERTFVVPAQADVADFIENQSLRAGLTADQVDVSTIDDSFWGLTLRGPASARANIAPVLTYSALGVVEEDGVLRFFHRADKTSVATVSYDELAFAEDGGEPGDPFPVTHANAQELPRSITVSYNDPNFDYQTSTVKAMRYAVDTVLDETQSLDMAITGDRAASIARRLLFERWLAQNTRSCNISRKFAYLSAGDVMTVEYPRSTLSEWVISKVTDTGARIEIECFPSDSDLIIQTVPGPGGYRAQAIPEYVGATAMEPLDMPIIRDGDSNPGLYVALGGYNDAWRGATLQVGPDANSLDDAGLVRESAVIGYAETVLPNGPTAIVDEASVLTIRLATRGELFSTTNDLLLNTTVNAAVVGINGRLEVLQFRTATDLGDNRWRLTGLVRGRLGTEQYTGTHAENDVFVLLQLGGMLRPYFDIYELGQPRLFYATSLGMSTPSVQEETNTGVGLMPRSVVNLRGTRDASGNLTMAWDRRTRFRDNFLLGIVPLGETSEQYEVDILSGSTVKRTLTSTTPTVAYSAADQTTDFGSLQSAVSTRAYQISSSIGRGYVAAATL